MKASDFIYCSKCGVERSPASLITNRRKTEIEVCLNPLTGGYLDPYRYETKTQIIIEKLCPICKKVLKEIKWVEEA